MRYRRRIIYTAFALLRVMGLWKYIIFLAYYFVTRPIYWEWMLVRKVRGKRLNRALFKIEAWRSEALVSVILPVNNGRSRGVERLVASLKAQTYPHIEFIAVDSGSTDDTVTWLKAEGFNVIEIEPSSFTHAYSRNTGAAAARGTYLLFTVDDAEFRDSDWLRSALYLMEHFRADSLSSRQTVDDKADPYARCLDTWLSRHQSDTLGVNLSRNSWFAKWLRHVLPLGSQTRSVSIDNTNHLVRKATFDRIRFHAATVEDVDFALRLTKAGGRTLYTNLLSILHYHSYDTITLAKYARRVFIDTKVIARWHPYPVSFASRESFLTASFHALGIFLKVFELRGSEFFAVNAPLPRYRRKIDGGYLKYLSFAIKKIKSYHLKSINFRNENSFEVARSIYIEITGAPPPSWVHWVEAESDYVLQRLEDNFVAAMSAIFSSGRQIYEMEDVRVIFLFVWVNFVMSHLGRPEIFERTQIFHPFDKWNIGDWA